MKRFALLCYGFGIAAVCVVAVFARVGEERYRQEALSALQAAAQVREATDLFRRSVFEAGFMRFVQPDTLDAEGGWRLATLDEVIADHAAEVAEQLRREGGK